MVPPSQNGGPSGRAESPVYDPDQDAHVKRDIRQKYRVLQKSHEDTRAQDHKIEELLAQVQQADSLFSRVKNPTEATLDSSILLDLSGISANKARSIKLGGGAFDVDDFVTKLITFMGGRQQLPDDESDGAYDDYGNIGLDWSKVGRKALAKSRRVPVTDFMLGPLSIEHKKRNIGKRSKLEKNKEDERKPQEIKEEDISRSQNETVKNVATIERLLGSCGSINIFRFVVNPNDFAQSVENLFYVSFLIRDGRCALEIEKGEPKIFTCETPTQEDYVNGELQKKQIVMEFDMATWRRAIEVFDIRESKIPQRPPAKTRLGDKWYG